MAIIQQGKFTSDGTAKELAIRSDVDYIHVLNETIADADQTTAIATEFYWQRGMTADRGIVYKKSNAAGAANLTDYLASGGFTLLDTSVMTYSALNTGITAVSNATPPLVSLPSTTGIADGDVVRLYNIVDAQQLGGVDFMVDNLVANTQFDLQWAPTIVAGTTGSLRKIVNWNPLYYPRRRVIVSISQAASAVIVLTVTHGFTVGQQLRFAVSADFGMVEMDGLSGTVTAIDTTTNSITVDIDSTAFTAYAWPLTAVVPVTHGQVIPLGEAAEETYANLLDDATLNTGIIGMTLAGGAASPGGAANDVMYWRAGKSDLINNE